MNDLQTITFIERRLRPLCARNDFTVMFDGNTITLQSKLGNKLVEGS